METYYEEVGAFCPERAQLLAWVVAGGPAGTPPSCLGSSVHHAPSTHLQPRDAGPACAAASSEDGGPCRRAA